MKKLLFAAVDMNVGGIETALLTLLNYLAQKDYEITLVLEKKQGTFLQNLNDKINILEYKPNNFKIVPIRKTVNFLKRLNFTLKYKNKFDFAASFATYSNMASFVARTASKNSALWGHADYLELFGHDAEKVKSFFKNLHYDEFKNIIFVSKKAKETFFEIFEDCKEKVIVCNNIIDYKKIENLANEDIEEKKNTYTFVNIGRHDEKQKKLTRILEASKKLKQEGYKFEVWFIGEGEDTNKYKKFVKEHKLEDYIKFMGVKKNPYPYMRLADSVILSSDYEGYPVVFVEAFVLNKPIITTDISDALEDVQNKYGIVTSKDAEGIYDAMKKFLENKPIMKEKFNPEEYNKKNIEIIEKIINNKY